MKKLVVWVLTLCLICGAYTVLAEEESHLFCGQYFSVETASSFSYAQRQRELGFEEVVSWGDVCSFMIWELSPEWYATHKEDINVFAKEHKNEIDVADDSEVLFHYMQAISFGYSAPPFSRWITISEIEDIPVKRFEFRTDTHVFVGLVYCIEAGGSVVCYFYNSDGENTTDVTACCEYIDSFIASMKIHGVPVVPVE